MFQKEEVRRIPAPQTRRKVRQHAEGVRSIKDEAESKLAMPGLISPGQKSGDSLSHYLPSLPGPQSRVSGLCLREPDGALPLLQVSQGPQDGCLFWTLLHLSAMLCLLSIAQEKQQCILQRKYVHYVEGKKDR